MREGGICLCPRVPFCVFVLTSNVPFICPRISARKCSASEQEGEDPGGHQASEGLRESLITGVVYYGG